MDQANAEEFYEVYKGVVTEYSVSMNTSLFWHHIEYTVLLLLFYFLNNIFLVALSCQ